MSITHQAPPHPRLPRLQALQLAGQRLEGMPSFIWALLALNWLDLSLTFEQGASLAGPGEGTKLPQVSAGEARQQPRLPARQAVHVSK